MKKVLFATIGLIAAMTAYARDLVIGAFDQVFSTHTHPALDSAGGDPSPTLMITDGPEIAARLGDEIDNVDLKIIATETGDPRPMLLTRDALVETELPDIYALQADVDVPLPTRFELDDLRDSAADTNAETGFEFEGAKLPPTMAMLLTSALIKADAVRRDLGANVATAMTPAERHDYMAA